MTPGDDAAPAPAARTFDFNQGVHGVRVIVREDVATPDSQFAACLSDEAIDQEIQLLKEELDALAPLMKQALRQLISEPLSFGP
jgi:hypothetical protein